MPAVVREPRWFMDENSAGVAKALHHVRGDVTWPGAPGGPVAAGTPDSVWLPVVGSQELVVLTRDKKIRQRSVERRKFVESGVRGCFLTSGGQLDLFSQLRLWLRWWDEIETLVATKPGPWLAGVTSSGVRLFETPDVGG